MRWLLTFVTTLCLLAPVWAEDSAFVLYANDVDVTGDGVPERLMVISRESQHPEKETLKEFWILKRSGDRFERVFKSGPHRGAFRTRMDQWQWESPETVPAGIQIRPTGGYPEIVLVFAPNSGDFVVYRYDGTNFKQVDTGM